MRGAEERALLEGFREKLLHSVGLHFSRRAPELSAFPAPGTTREQMPRKSLPGTACCKLHGNFHTPISAPQEAGVRKFVVGSGAQGDVKTIAPTLMLAPLSFK